MPWGGSGCLGGVWVPRGRAPMWPPKVTRAQRATCWQRLPPRLGADQWEAAGGAGLAADWRRSFRSRRSAPLRKRRSEALIGGGAEGGRGRAA